MWKTIKCARNIKAIKLKETAMNRQILKGYTTCFLKTLIVICSVLMLFLYNCAKTTAFVMLWSSARRKKAIIKLKNVL